MCVSTYYIIKNPKLNYWLSQFCDILFIICTCAKGNSLLETRKNMKLKEALELIWENRRYDTASETEAISHLNEEVAESLKALLRGDKERSQAELEDAFSCPFIALKVLNINPEEVVKRQINRMKNQPQRTMHIFSDKVEIRVGNEIKGGWGIWSSDDLKEAQKMAREFKCKIVWEEATQLSFKELILNANDKTE